MSRTVPAGSRHLRTIAFHGRGTDRTAGVDGLGRRSCKHLKTPSQDLFDLMKMCRKALISIFRELDAPEVREMDGEFRATLLDQGAWAQNFFAVIAYNMAGVWISKSFSPITATDGRGYNSFRIGANIRKTYLMRTYVGPSRLDGRPSYHLDYSTVNKNNVPSFTKLAGEVRKYGDALFLGIGTADFGFSRLRRERPFALEGPLARFDESVRAA